MRIIAGNKKGKKLKLPRAGKIRPTKQVVKEALFNILGQDLTGKKFLDLFAGSGGVGLEALSRGAELAVFIENNFAVKNILEENLDACGFQDRGKIFPIDVRAFFKKTGLDLGQFDYIFLDPPYETDLGLLVMQELGKSDILKPEALVIFEHFDKLLLIDEIGRLEKFKESHYGDCVLSFFKVKNEKSNLSRNF